MTGRLLAIDTATTACSVALFDDNILIASEYEEIGRGHAEKLIPMIAALPGKGRSDRIIVNCGPGSFTGVRIGVSAAKALGLAWGVRVDGYQCLSLVAAQARQILDQQIPICVAMAAGHGEFFVQNFDGPGLAIDALVSLSPVASLDHAKSNIIAGSAARALAEGLANGEFHEILPNAAKSYLLLQEMKQLKSKPIYGRQPDAKPTVAV